MITDIKEFINILFNNIDKSWLHILKTDTYIKPIITNVVRYLYENQDFLPLPAQIFRVFSMPLSKVRVVIVGQDPYPNPGDADGLAFSAAQSTLCPKSLQNIFGALKHSKLIDIRPTNYDLISWHNQGIFLINYSLSLDPKSPDSHKKLWNGFAENIISYIANNLKVTPIYFLLWGTNAKTLEPTITQSNYPHRILSWSHPVAMGKNVKAFKYCDHFKILTEELKINWSPLDRSNRIMESELKAPLPQDVKSQAIQLAPAPAPPADERVNFIIKDRTIWFTDGSCRNQQNNPKSDEWGVLCCIKGGNPHKLHIGGSNARSTNYKPSSIKGEGQAILYVLQHLDTSSQNIIYTDSQHWVDMIYRYMPKWSPDIFQSKSNPHLTVPINTLYQKYKDIVKIQHIPAYHALKPANEFERVIYQGNKKAEEIAKSYYVQ